MKFTDPIFHPPKKLPPATSWWADRKVQQDRTAFANIAKAEESRIVGHQTFGGRKRTHNKFDGHTR